MANTVKMKQSSVAGKVPTTAQLALGELAINTVDGKLFLKKNVAGTETIVDVTGAASGVSSFNTRTGAVVLNASDVNAAMAADTSAAKMPVGTTAQRPASPSSGMFRMNSTTKVPEWYESTSGTWIPFSDAGPYQIEYLIVAGGGGGACLGGGGGAGGFISATDNVSPGSVRAAVVGAGGTAGYNGARPGSGGNSSFNGQTATGGGGGGGNWNDSVDGGSGGSGGGGGNGTGSGLAGGSGTSGQGNAGGTRSAAASPYFSGSGGGASAAGAGAAAANNGGAGLQWPSGSGIYYAGGGGGTGWANVGGGAGAGGLGGGGSGTNNSTGGAGTANTGGGGGGSGYPGASNFVWGGAGGSGVVIVRYLGAQRGSGGNVTSSGGYTYHTFTASGTFTA